MKNFQIPEGQCRKIVQHYKTQSQLWDSLEQPCCTRAHGYPVLSHQSNFCRVWVAGKAL